MVIGSVQQGYVPGQKIELQLDISNNSRVNIKGIDTKLIKEVRFSSESENFIRRDLTTIATQRHTGFNAAREKTKTYRITVAVPPTPPTEEEAGDVIKVLYKIEVNELKFLLIRLNFEKRINFDRCRLRQFLVGVAEI